MLRAAASSKLTWLDPVLLQLVSVHMAPQVALKNSQPPKAPSACTYRTVVGLYISISLVHQLHSLLYFQCMLSVCLLNTDTEASADHHSCGADEKGWQVSLNLFDADYLCDNEKLTMMSTQACTYVPNSRNLHSSILPLHCTAMALACTKIWPQKFSFSSECG